MNERKKERKTERKKERKKERKTNREKERNKPTNEQTNKTKQTNNSFNIWKGASLQTCTFGICQSNPQRKFSNMPCQKMAGALSKGIKPDQQTKQGDGTFNQTVQETL